MNWEVKIISTSLISTLKFHTCPEDFEHFQTQPNYKGTDPVHKKNQFLGGLKVPKMWPIQRKNYHSSKMGEISGDVKSTDSLTSLMRLLTNYEMKTSILIFRHQ